MLSFRDLCRLCADCHPLFLVAWSLATYHDGRHGRAMINNLQWLPIKAHDIWWGYLPVAILYIIVIFVFSVWHSSICFQRLGFASPDLLSKSSCHIHWAWQDEWFVEFNFCTGKLMALFFHSIAGIAMAEFACANLIFTSFADILSLVCFVPKYLNWWFTSSCTFPFSHILVDGMVDADGIRICLTCRFKCIIFS